MQDYVTFYRFPVSQTNGEYPLLHTGDDYSNYRIAQTSTKVKYRPDLVQTLTVPTFTGYQDVNMCFLPSVGWFWVQTWTTRAFQDSEIVDLGMTYNPVTSLLTDGQSVTGLWKRTPANECPYLQNMILTDAMSYKRKVDFARIGDCHHIGHFAAWDPDTPYSHAINDRWKTANHRMFWVEIVATYDVVNETNDTLVKYGFFVSGDDESYSWGIPIKVQTYGTQRYMDGGQYDQCLSYYNSTSDWKRYPALADVITNPETSIGLQADTIIQIAISERCPYACSEHCTQWKPTTGSAESYVGWYWTLDDITMHYFGDNSSMYVSSVDWPASTGHSETVTMTLTEQERALGSVRIINESGVAVATVPTQYGSTIAVTTRTYSDYSGIYTELIYDGRIVTTVPEGHLPWVGSTWEAYQAYNMRYDRECVNIANSKVVSDLQINLADISNTLAVTQISSMFNVDIWNPQSFVTTAELLSANKWKAQNDMAAARTQADKEQLYNWSMQLATQKKMQAASGTAYDVGYGTIYMINCLAHAANVRLEMPSQYTAEYYTNFVARTGYPAEGVHTITIDSGYLQGILYNDVTLTASPRFEALARIVQQGIKMTKIRGII